jgi:signal transduction histidine kinase
MRADGQYRWILDNGAPIYDSKNVFIGYIGSCVDITKRKLAEQALIQAQLDSEKALKIRTQFISNMSHEIRTPMNGIIGLSSLALNHPMSEELRGYLENIEASSKSLLKILNEVLDFSKLEAGRVEIEEAPLKLNELLGGLQGLFEEGARQKGLNLICINKLDPSTVVLGDQFRLQQVLSNLIGNAIKFTSKGSIEVAIALRGLESSKIILRFSVKDSGMGIPSDLQHELIHPFMQADSSIARRFGGTGLGLAISNQLLELMGGKLTISSTVGVGSTFSFDLALEVADN